MQFPEYIITQMKELPAGTILQKAFLKLQELIARLCPFYPKNFLLLQNDHIIQVLNKSKIKATFNIKFHYWKESLKVCINKIQK
jgi:dTDP-4-dehydrorhamnose reductase